MYIGEYLGYQPGAVLAQCMLCTCNRDNMEALLWKAMSSFIQRLEDNFNSVSNLIYNSIGILRCIYRNFSPTTYRGLGVETDYVHFSWF